MLKLSQIPEITEVPSFSEEAEAYLEGLIDGFSMGDALEVKNIEKVTNHDVKAVEYFLKKKCQSHPEIAKVTNSALLARDSLLSCWIFCNYIKMSLSLDNLPQVLEFFHFACTSEDINNLAHALMLKEAMNGVVFPVMDKLIKAICKLAEDNASTSMLSRTHGQVI